MDKEQLARIENNRMITKQYLASKFNKRLERAQSKGIRFAKYGIAAAAVSGVTQLGMYLWYWLEYDINIRKPKASTYLKQRLR